MHMHNRLKCLVSVICITFFASYQASTVAKACLLLALLRFLCHQKMLLLPSDLIVGEKLQRRGVTVYNIMIVTMLLSARMLYLCVGILCLIAVWACKCVSGMGMCMCAGILKVCDCVYSGILCA